MKVLILEDDENYANLIARYIKPLTREIVFAKDWDDVERHIAPDFNVLWFDLLVPGIDHDEALVKIAAVRDKHKDPVILIVSGAPDSDLANKARAAGADMYAEKMDSVTQSQVIALLIHAMMHASERGVNMTKFLERARHFNAQPDEPTNSIKATLA